MTNELFKIFNYFWMSLSYISRLAYKVVGFCLFVCFLVMLFHLKLILCFKKKVVFRRDQKSKWPENSESTNNQKKKKEQIKTFSLFLLFLLRVKGSCRHSRVSAQGRPWNVYITLSWGNCCSCWAAEWPSLLKYCLKQHVRKTATFSSQVSCNLWTSWFCWVIQRSLTRQQDGDPEFISSLSCLFRSLSFAVFTLSLLLVFSFLLSIRGKKKRTTKE